MQSHMAVLILSSLKYSFRESATFKYSSLFLLLLSRYVNEMFVAYFSLIKPE